MRIICRIDEKFYIAGRKAVSYTHLDVYKRQSLNNGQVKTVNGMQVQPLITFTSDQAYVCLLYTSRCV